MKKLETLIALSFGVILVFFLFESAGINERIRSNLFELSKPSFELRRGIVNIYSKVIEKTPTTFPEITIKSPSGIEVHSPLIVGFYNHTFGNYVILDSPATALERSPVISVQSKRLSGIVVKSDRNHVIVEPLRNLSSQLPAVAFHETHSIEGFLQSKGKNLYFRTFDPEELFPGDKVFISSEMEGFGYFYSLEATYIGDVLSAMPEGYLLNFEEMKPGYYIFLEDDE
ncbi:hypothetical protein [Kosmotoga pacifica]|uniref:Cell shape-determining protein MreC n=1 Tax=Kosmotoga pacifica TaxID=1330330 RepID=A0A0G2Z926_9BACT|nr:hypothetical protein [Kosmotoga pacifica]AKI98062.1 hypothetical protein IX53_09745 [Kosmotoga pacifica]